MGTVTVLDTDVEIIEYRGERVTTFAAVDRLHQRPDGTAGRTYRENRDRFVEGKDTITLDQPDEIRRLGLTRPQGGTPASLTLLTRRGYLKLVKPLTDDRAWAVQGEMIERYFDAEFGSSFIASTIPAAAAAFQALHGVALLIGCDANQSALSANRGTARATGVNLLDLMGQTHLTSPQQARLLTPTDLGKELGGKSAVTVNRLLKDRGFQDPTRDAKGRAGWEPTERGKPLSTFQDTGKKHSDGTPVRQLKWSADILPHLRDRPDAAAA